MEAWDEAAAWGERGYTAMMFAGAPELNAHETDKMGENVVRDVAWHERVKEGYKKDLSM